MLTTQGFLLTLLALIFRTGACEDIRISSTIPYIPVLGIVLGVMYFLSVFGARLALGNLKEKWERWRYKEGFPRPFGLRWASRLGSVPHFLPLVFVLLWVFIGVVVFDLHKVVLGFIQLVGSVLDFLAPVFIILWGLIGGVVFDLRKVAFDLIQLALEKFMGFLQGR